MEPAETRVAWHQLEAVNAVAYFSQECRNALKDLGLRGFWMGYFAGRAAPMGVVSPGVVEATFYNFHPAMVRRSLPYAWTLASPDSVMLVRTEAAAAALRRLAPEADEVVPRLLPLLREAIEHGNGAGRSLFAANRDVVVSDDLRGLWQAATTLREHRGDGHVAILTEADLDGCEAHVLFAATEGGPPEVLRDNRGWSEHDWGRATSRLCRRGLVSTVEPLVGSPGRAKIGRVNRASRLVTPVALPLTGWHNWWAP
ncbi:MAG: SCO6745 family protein, partial [Acidimicrobiales bacterium]